MTKKEANIRAYQLFGVPEVRAFQVSSPNRDERFCVGLPADGGYLVLGEGADYETALKNAEEAAEKFVADARADMEAKGETWDPLNLLGKAP